MPSNKKITGGDSALITKKKAIVKAKGGEINAPETRQQFTGGTTVNYKGKDFTLSADQVKKREALMKKKGIDVNNTDTNVAGGAVVPTGGTTNSGSPSETVVNENKASIDDRLKKAQEDALAQTKEDEATFGANYIKNKEETDAYAKDKIRTANDYYNDNAKLINKQNDDIRKIEERQIDAYGDRIDRDSELLKDKQESETAYLKAQQEHQRVQNANAIQQAKVDVEILRQQSAWGYNKIGLGFSSGIINQSQQIATEGITKIAEIKAQMTMDEATIATKVADVEFRYASLVNSTIDKYTDKIDSVKKEMKTRINSTAQNLLKNSFAKKTDVEATKQWAREEKQKAERQHITDIQAVKDKGIEYLKDIQAGVEKFQKVETEKLNLMLENGTIMNLSPEQIVDKELALNLPAGTINAQMNNGLDREIKTFYDSVLGEGFITGNYSSIREDVKNNMRLGMTMQGAVESAVQNNIETDPNLVNRREDIATKKSLDERKFEFEKLESDRDFNVEKAQLELDNAYKSGQLSLSQYSAETSRMNAITNRKNANNNSSPSLYGANTELSVGDKFNGAGISQTYGTKSVLTSDNVELANGEVGTPGVDIAYPEGTPLKSFAGGKVVSVTTGKGNIPVTDVNSGKASASYGNQVVIEDEAGNKHYYNHLKDVNVEEGDEINVGEEFGTSGNSGTSTGAHLDYRVKSGDGWEDPRGFMFDDAGFDETINTIAQEKKATELGVSILKSDTKQTIQAKINKAERANRKTEDANLTKGVASTEQIVKLVGNDTILDIMSKNDNRNTDGLTKTFEKLRQKGVDDEKIVDYLVNNGAITRGKGAGYENIASGLTDFDLGDRGLYIGKDGNIYRADNFLDTLIYKIK